MEKTVSCKAKLQFVEYVDGHGMVVCNGSGKVEIPVSAVSRLAAAEKIEAPKGWDQEGAEAEAEQVSAETANGTAP